MKAIIDHFDVESRKVQISSPPKFPLVVKDGVRILSIRTDNPKKQIDISMPDFEVMIEEPGLQGRNMPALRSLNYLCKYVRRIVKEVEPEFDGTR